MRTPAFCICENKAADQLHGNCTADQHLYFRFIDRPIPFFSKSEISSLYPSPLTEQPGLYWTYSEAPHTFFSRHGLNVFSLLATQVQ